MKKLNICIVFGGKSGEHEISILSASNIYQSINKNKHNVNLIGITKEGQFVNFDNRLLEKNDKTSSLPESKSKLLETVTQESEIGLYSKHVSETLKNVDVFLPIVHGSFGEDGSLQGFFETINKAYVGSAVLGSAASMDKDVMKRLLKEAGLPISKFLVIKKSDKKINFENIIDTLGLPIFVKPANLGSSVGISKAYDMDQLQEGIDNAFKYDTKVILEESVNVKKEVEVSVLGNNDPIASIPGEIVTNSEKHEFYSYEAKYVDPNGAALKIPADIDKAQIRNIQELAVRVFRVLECSGLARIDFFIDSKDKIFVNEINTLPGFTNTSMFTKLWEYSGLEMPDLIDKLIELAVEKQTEKDSLKRSFN